MLILIPNYNHRNPCSSTPQTCGRCLDKFTGIDGDSNSECAIVKQSIASGGNQTVSVIKGCDPAKCGTPWQFCNNTTKQCEVIIK